MPFNWLLFKNGFCARLKSSVCFQFRFLFRHLVLSRHLPWNDLIRWIILKDLNFHSKFWTIFRCKISIFDGEFQISNKKLKVFNEKWEFFDEKWKKFDEKCKIFDGTTEPSPFCIKCFQIFFLNISIVPKREKKTHSWLCIRIYIDLIDLFPSMLIGSSIYFNWFYMTKCGSAPVRSTNKPIAPFKKSHKVPCHVKLKQLKSISNMFWIYFQSDFDCRYTCIYRHLCWTLLINCALNVMDIDNL